MTHHESLYPLVSVVIPTHNRRQALERAIESILNQTYKNFEIIIVDDASTDGTTSFLNEKYNKKIQLFTLQNNMGAAYCRNHGVIKSKGSLVCFLDSDDTWTAEKLYKQVNLWRCKSELDRSKFFSYTSVVIIKPNQKDKISPTEHRLEMPLSRYLFCNSNAIQTSTFMISHELISKHSFRNIKKHQDWDLIFSLDKANITMDFINEPLVHWIQDQKQRVSMNFDIENSAAWYKQIVKSKDSEVCFYKIAIFPFMVKVNIFKMCKQIYQNSDNKLMIFHYLLYLILLINEKYIKRLRQSN